MSPFLKKYAPQYWGLWLGLGILYLCSHLSYRWQLRLGKGLGKLIYQIVPSRRRVAARNIGLCFPQLSPLEQTDLLKQHFMAIGIGVFELGMAWWWSPQDLNKLFQIKGREHLEQALARGRGIIILGSHNTTMELMCSYLDGFFKMGVFYREQSNVVMNELLYHFRKRCQNVTLIHRRNMRKLVEFLQENLPVLYAADQDYGRKHSVFSDFFGIPAATITTPWRLAQKTGAALLPVAFYRKAGVEGYQIEVLPEIVISEQSPPEEYAYKMNKILEQTILIKPEQYFWLHRRFKTRPEGEINFY